MWGAALATTIVVGVVLLSAPRATPEAAGPPAAAAAAPPTVHDERPRVVPATPVPATPVPSTAPAAVAPAALVDPALDLRAGPVAVPIALELPSIGVHAEVLGVGLGDDDVMDAPTGGAVDPVWGQAFWYRGSAVPGAASTALIAGHIGSRHGPGVFARLDEMVPGDPIVVHDLRTGLGTRFVVIATTEYSLEEAARPEVLERIYGAGPVAGEHPQPSTDGLAHLTLVTCAGTFRGDTHDHRRVVSAVVQP